MATADKSRAASRSRNWLIAAICWLLPLLAGAAWALLTGALLWSLAVLPNARGLRTPLSLFAHPVMMFVSSLPFVFLAWGPVLLFGYYAVLTRVVWNAPRGFRQLWLATALYGLHLVLNFICALLSADSYPPSGARSNDSWGDLTMLLELARLAPLQLAAFGLCLLAWHMFVWWRLWLGWLLTMRPNAPFNDEIGSKTDGNGG